MELDRKFQQKKFKKKTRQIAGAIQGWIDATSTMGWVCYLSITSRSFITLCLGSRVSSRIQNYDIISEVSEHDHEVERLEVIQPWTNNISASITALADTLEPPPHSLISVSCKHTFQSVKDIS